MAKISDDLVRTYMASDALTLAALVRRREVAPEEWVEAAVTLIERFNPHLNAVVHKLYDFGRADAAHVDRNATFAGVPFLLKELASMWQGAPFTNASAWMKDVVAPVDSEIVRRMKQAGLLLIGKSNSPENGWSIGTAPKLYGATCNPWREDVTPGGSSGGAAASVAARLVPIAEASDAAGSIRVPASCCGLVGLKPSRGRVTPSPLADIWYGGAYSFMVSRSVRDSAAYLDAVAGALVGEPYALPLPALSWGLAATRPARQWRIGFTVRHPQNRDVDPDAIAAVQHTAATLAKLGHTVEEHDMCHDGDQAWSVWTRIAAVQNAAVTQMLAPLVGRPMTEHDVEPITWALQQKGHAISGVEHNLDVAALRTLGRDITADLLPYDIFITPTLTQKPRPLGYYDMSGHDLDAYHAKWADAAFMFPFNMSGLPAVSLPLLWSTDGLPMGVQLVGRMGDEATLLAAATVLEQEMPWRDRMPPLVANELVP